MATALLWPALAGEVQLWVLVPIATPLPTPVAACTANAILLSPTVKKILPRILRKPTAAET